MPRLLALWIVAGLAACTTAPPPVVPPPAAHIMPTARDSLRPEWNDTFRAYGVEGVFVLYEPETGTVHRSDARLAAERRVPASTFKVYNALVALETGVVRDPDSLFAWDGVERSIADWNRDHSLRSGMEFSTVWLYQRVAQAVGAERYRAAFAREPYGNGQVGESVTTFWLDGPLGISPDEQVAFLDRLRLGRLAFRPEVQATVRDLLVSYGEAGGTIRGKTGWQTEADGTDLGWLVGWVERSRPHPQGRGTVAVFAMQVRAPAEAAPGRPPFDMIRARRAIVRGLLTTEDWLDALY